MNGGHGDPSCESAALCREGGQPIALDVPDPFLYHVVVDQGHIDPQGHVNNAVYVGWMDEAAYAHSAALGYTWERYRSLGASFVVRRHEIDYLQPAYAGDRLVVATWPGPMRRFNAYRRHQIVRLGDGATLVRARTLWIYLDHATGRPQRIPRAMIERFSPREENAAAAD